MNEIYITRGDTLRLSVEITDENGNPYQLQNGDILRFTVKKSVFRDEIIIQKEIKDMIHISPEDTNGLEFRDYVYDIELTMANGDVCTVIKPTLFRVEEEVTTHESRS